MILPHSYYAVLLLMVLAYTVLGGMLSVLVTVIVAALSGDVR